MSAKNAVEAGIAEANIPSKPRLKRGETPQSPEFQKRMKAYNRAVALAEATAAKAEQDMRESETRAKRDVMAESESTSSTAAPAKKTETKPESTEDKKEKGIKGAAQNLRSRTRNIDEAVEGAQRGRKK